MKFTIFQYPPFHFQNFGGLVIVALRSPRWLCLYKWFCPWLTVASNGEPGRIITACLQTPQRRVTAGRVKDHSEAKQRLRYTPGHLSKPPEAECILTLIHPNSKCSSWAQRGGARLSPLLTYSDNIHASSVSPPNPRGGGILSWDVFCLIIFDEIKQITHTYTGDGAEWKLGGVKWSGTKNMSLCIPLDASPCH